MLSDKLYYVILYHKIALGQTYLKYQEQNNKK